MGRQGRGLIRVGLVPLGLDTRHYAVLGVLAAGAGSSQRTIADALGLDRATVVALVDTLESQAWRDGLKAVRIGA